jgi:hypothetical protein
VEKPFSTTRLRMPALKQADEFSVRVYRGSTPHNEYREQDQDNLDSNVALLKRCVLSCRAKSRHLLLFIRALDNNNERFLDSARNDRAFQQSHEMSKHWPFQFKHQRL